MRLRLSLLSALVFLVAAGTAQQQEDADISEIAAHAGIIFRGTVLAVVTTTPRAPGEVTATRVTFRVEDGIRGTSTGQTLTVRQWNVAADEYRVGETLLLFLYAPSEMGFTSAVGGRAGHRRGEEISVEVLNSLRTAPFSATPASVATDGPQRPARATRGQR